MQVEVFRKEDGSSWVRIDDAAPFPIPSGYRLQMTPQRACFIDRAGREHPLLSTVAASFV